VPSWLPALGLAKERPSAALRGFKLAHPMLSADRTRVGFSGVTLGRTHVYGVLGEAECAQGGHHRSPSKWCDCGFYCLHSLDDARALTCDPDYRYTALLEVAASGRFLRYERGLRYATQRITAVRLGRCGCGGQATVFAETGAGMVGWRRLMGTCASCCGSRASIPLPEFTRLLGGPPVGPDETPSAMGGSAPGDAERAAQAVLLAAEVELLQARLDEVQRQLAQLATDD
jgi:hypothetical protein